VAWVYILFVHDGDGAPRKLAGIFPSREAAKASSRPARQAHGRKYARVVPTRLGKIIGSISELGGYDPDAEPASAFQH
jgi:hypothetical protein